MFPNEFLDIFKVKLVLQTPIAILLIKSLIASIIFYLLFKIFRTKRWFGILSAILFVSFGFYYFGILPTIVVLLIFTGSFLTGRKVLKISNFPTALFIGVLIFVQIFIVISLVINLNIAFYSLLIISVMLVCYKYNNNLEILNDWSKSIRNYIKEINIIDYLLIILSFVLGSLPQSHWDAVHANLYNAKWYVINNSLIPLPESISSLFPQNAELYYSLFYKIGGVRTLQLAYILPLIILILLVKDISKRVKSSPFLNYSVYLFLLTPIVIFESSNGYYDLLVLLTVFIPIFILFFQGGKNILRDTLIASFIIGFGAATKYFPIILIFFAFYSPLFV